MLSFPSSAHCEAWLNSEQDALRNVPSIDSCKSSKKAKIVPDSPKTVAQLRKLNVDNAESYSHPRFTLVGRFLYGLLALKAPRMAKAFHFRRGDCCSAVQKIVSTLNSATYREQSIEAESAV